MEGEARKPSSDVAMVQIECIKQKSEPGIIRALNSPLVRWW